jgi:hypothetical protein
LKVERCLLTSSSFCCSFHLHICVSRCAECSKT